MKKQKEFFNLFDVDTANGDIWEDTTGSQFSFFENNFSSEESDVPEDGENEDLNGSSAVYSEDTASTSLNVNTENNAAFSTLQDNFSFSVADTNEQFVPDELGESTVEENSSTEITENGVEIEETEDAEDAEEVEDNVELTTDDTAGNFNFENADDEDGSYYAYNFDAEKMVSILEDDVSAEITEPLEIPPLRKEHVQNNTVELKNFKEIRKISTADRFETPYVYSAKSGDRVRYRLALPSDRNPRKARKIKDILNMTATLLIALLIALLLRSFVFVFATVNGPSMQPTLQTGEKIFVTRYSYYLGEIERGDIIVCKYPSEMYPDNYVKRVIALGGERVRVQDGKVYINDVPLPEDYIYSAPREDMAEVTVPDGSVFVMGDNRNNSTDSRKSYIGPISKKLIIGKARCIIYPFSEIRSLETEN